MTMSRPKMGLAPSKWTPTSGESRGVRHVTRARATCIVLSLLLVLPVSNALSQISSTESPLHERQPFDRITLDAQNDSAEIEVFPIDSVARSVRPTEVGSLVVRRLVDPPTQLYSIKGEHIVTLELFPFILLDEAKRLLSSDNTDEAFYVLARLKNDFPDTPGLATVTEEFFFADAKQLFANNRFDEALLALNEVFRLNPNRPRLPLVLDRTLSRILQQEFDQGNYASVRQKLSYAQRKYGDITRTTVATWERRILQVAQRELAEAQRAFSEGDATRALALNAKARKIWPNLRDVDELEQAILAKYPRIRVGVTQPFQTTDDTTAVSLNWAARRTGRLIFKDLSSLRDFTADGGQYESSVGTLTVNPSRTQVVLELRPQYASRTIPLSRALLRLAAPSAATYSRRWEEFLDSIYVSAADRIEINFTRPTILPEGLLPRRLHGAFAELLSGEYKKTEDSTNAVQTFRIADPDSSTSVREVAEIFFENPSAASSALLSGDIDVIDRVAPRDLPELRHASHITVIPYRLPTVHGLVFNDREPLLRSSTFRRGLLYAINRAGFVNDELIAGGDSSTAQVLSGFAPFGRSADDPLGYAYDNQIVPRSHDPALGLVLLRLAMAERAKLQVGDKSPTDEDQDEQPPGMFDLPPLVLAYPDSPIAVPASNAIATDFRRLGLNVTLRPVGAGRGWPIDHDWDILYVEATIEEPFVDLANLILGESILGRHGGLVWQEARTLQESTNLEEARNRLFRIHKLTFDHTPMIPLWQVVEHAAVSGKVLGVSNAPISLYHKVSDWRLGR